MTVTLMYQLQQLCLKCLYLSLYKLLWLPMLVHAHGYSIQGQYSTYVASHCDTEELFWKVMLVFLLNNGQSSCLKHLVEPLHTSTAERNTVDSQQ